MSRKLLICTGEVSGDLQGSYLIQALLAQDPSLEITAIGGQRMAASGAKLLRDTTHISSVGLVEALPFILPTLRTTHIVRQYLRQQRPDLLILIDYIGVNSQILHIANQFGIPAVYYIAPQDWVWSPQSRLSYQLSRQTRLILSIFPEEARFYEAKGANVRWVGHPFVDTLAQGPDRHQIRHQLGIPEASPWVLLLPASRRQEVQDVAPVIFATAQRLQAARPGIRFSLALANPRFAQPLSRLARRYRLHLDLIPGSPQQVMPGADFILSKSGTVNLEAAMFGIPQLVVYRVHPFTYWVGKHVLRLSIPFMCPVNLVQMRPIVPEFLQDAAQPQVMADLALELLQGGSRRQQMLADYQSMKQALGSPGVLRRAAGAILQLLELL
ncbi:MAG: lipid-A-disaccharide synthase [Thermostichales cyanobacterium SZTDM-1c_bins_54]